MAYKDGRAAHPLYHTYMEMLRRCYNKKASNYLRYGGRGIRVYEEWRNDFWQFVHDVGDKPGPSYSLDRKNNDGNYIPDNIQWSTCNEQNRNKSDNHLIEYNNEILTCIEWSEKTGIPAHTLRWRNRRGLDPFVTLQRNHQRAKILRQILRQAPHLSDEEICWIYQQEYGQESCTKHNVAEHRKEMRRNKSMANAKGQHIDTTALTVWQTMSRKYLHRDYLAHCAKYSYFIKFLREQEYWNQPWILDVGCGYETPLAQPLAARQNITIDAIGYYVGVDIGKIDRKWLSEASTFPAVFMPQTDFAEITWSTSEYQFELINCQEVLEHVEPEHAFRMLKKMYEYMTDDGRAIISTPVFNGKAASNHVNEMSFYAFETLMELAGLGVEYVTGTFASQKDYRHTLSPEFAQFFDYLSEHYEAEMVSVIMGPLVDPSHARNCLWRMTKSLPITLDDSGWDYLAKAKHGSSDQWTPFIESLRPRRKVKQLRGG